MHANIDMELFDFFYSLKHLIQRETYFCPFYKSSEFCFALKFPFTFYYQKAHWNLWIQKKVNLCYSYVLYINSINTENKCIFLVGIIYTTCATIHTNNDKTNIKCVRKKNSFRSFSLVMLYLYLLIVLLKGNIL